MYFVIYASGPHPVSFHSPYSTNHLQEQIHLHGHDFAIIAFNDTAPNKCDPRWVPDPSTYNLKNPPRRDVVMTPQNGGYVVIAFRTDNPGTWLMHCHIAFHASFGLALQFLERQQDAADMWPSHKDPAIAEAQRVCNNWNKWWGDCRDWWPGGVRTFLSLSPPYIFFMYCVSTFA